MKHSKYAQQYCEKHDQWYADFLDKCPICVGEQMILEPPPPKDHYNCEKYKENLSSNKPEKKQVQLVKKPKLIKRKKTKEYSTPKLFNF